MKDSQKLFSKGVIKILLMFIGFLISIRLFTFDLIGWLFVIVPILGMIDGIKDIRNSSKEKLEEKYLNGENILDD